MKKDLLVKDHGIRLLEAQIATGGIIDPVHSHRLPVEVAYKRGYFDEEMNRILCDPSDDTKGFFDPNTHENLTYMQLLSRCDEQAEKTLRLATVDVSVGEFQGRKVSVWELLFSKYLSEEKRQEVLEKYRAGTVTLEELVRILTTIVEEKEEREAAN
ncbi:unnamed protein product [Caretta caretta]